MRTIKVTVPDPDLLGATKEHVIDVEDEHAERIVRLGDGVYTDELDADGADKASESNAGDDTPSGMTTVITGPTTTADTSSETEPSDAAVSKTPKKAAVPKADTPTA